MNVDTKQFIIEDEDRPKDSRYSNPVLSFTAESHPFLTSNTNSHAYLRDGLNSAVTSEDENDLQMRGIKGPMYLCK
jgi:hypothetical protein